MKQPFDEDKPQLINRNKRAYHEYEILERLECGIELCGSEVKSIRNKNISFADSYCVVTNGELYVIGLHIAEYKMANRFGHEMTAKRKLLAHRRQIRKLAKSVEMKGMTLVPLSIYFLRGWCKCEIGLARGKREFDKRETIKRRESDREMSRAKLKLR